MVLLSLSLRFGRLTYIGGGTDEQCNARGRVSPVFTLLTSTVVLAYILVNIKSWILSNSRARRRGVIRFRFKTFLTWWYNRPLKRPLIRFSHCRYLRLLLVLRIYFDIILAVSYNRQLNTYVITIPCWSKAALVVLAAGEKPHITHNQINNFLL